MTKKTAPPLYEVEIIPAERRLSDRRKVQTDISGFLLEDRRKKPSRREGESKQSKK